MWKFYTVIYQTTDNKMHSVSFGDLKEACDYCYKLKECNDVIIGFVDDELHKKTYSSFNKEDV